MKINKSIWKFITVFILSFLLMECIEWLLDHFFHFNLHNLKWGWLGFIVIYSIKLHIFCCVLPSIFTYSMYKKSRKCKHSHCSACDN